jgi:hypothetical protein
MASREPFETMLTGGHPNSLGRTLEVVEMILADPARMETLYQCYFSEDEVVRLRVSNGMKRICRAQPDMLVPYLDRFLTDISQIQQASTQWTLAQLFLELQARLTPEQKTQAIVVMQKNMSESNDWIVLTMTLNTLGAWANKDEVLKAWLYPHLMRIAQDPRKAVSKNASGWLKKLFKA